MFYVFEMLYVWQVSNITISHIYLFIETLVILEMERPP